MKASATACMVAVFALLAFIAPLTGAAEPVFVKPETGSLQTTPVFPQIDPAWSTVYTADALPPPLFNTNFTGAEGCSGTISATGGILHGSTVESHGTCLWVNFWNATAAAGFTIEGRVKILRGGGYGGLGFAIWGSTENEAAFEMSPTQIIFLPSGITIAMSTSDAFHVYRMTVLGPVARLYIDGVLKGEGSPSSQYARHFVGFGDGSGVSDSDYELDYIGFSRSGAYSPGQLPPVSGCLAGATFCEDWDGFGTNSWQLSPNNEGYCPNNIMLGECAVPSDGVAGIFETCSTASIPCNRGVGFLHYVDNSTSTAGIPPDVGWMSAYSTSPGHNPGTEWTLEASIKVTRKFVDQPGLPAIQCAADNIDGQRRVNFALSPDAVYTGIPLRAVRAMDTTDGFHVYRMTRNASEVKLYVDGALASTLSSSAFESSSLDRLVIGCAVNEGRLELFMDYLFVLPGVVPPGTFFVTLPRLDLFRVDGVVFWIQTTTSPMSFGSTSEGIPVSLDASRTSFYANSLELGYFLFGLDSDISRAKGGEADSLATGHLADPGDVLLQGTVVLGLKVDGLPEWRTSYTLTLDLSLRMEFLDSYPAKLVEWTVEQIAHLLAEVHPILTLAFLPDFFCDLLQNPLIPTGTPCAPAVIVGASPVAVLVTSPSGGRIGTTSEREQLSEIPDAWYSGAEVEPQVVWMSRPERGAYNIALTATDAGEAGYGAGIFSRTGFLTENFSVSVLRGQVYHSSLTLSDQGLVVTRPEATSVPVDVLEELRLPLILTVGIAASGLIGMILLRRRRKRAKWPPS